MAASARAVWLASIIALTEKGRRNVRNPSTGRRCGGGDLQVANGWSQHAPGAWHGARRQCPACRRALGDRRRHCPEVCPGGLLRRADDPAGRQRGGARAGHPRARRDQHGGGPGVASFYLTSVRHYSCHRGRPRGRDRQRRLPGRPDPAARQRTAGTLSRRYVRHRTAHCLPRPVSGHQGGVPAMRERGTGSFFFSKNAASLRGCKRRTGSRCTIRA